MPKSKTPKTFSAYLVVASNNEAMPVDKILIDKGSDIWRDFNTINTANGDFRETTAKRLSRLCPECRVQHSKVGILGHDGECGSEDVFNEARQVLRDAEKRVKAEVTK